MRTSPAKCTSGANVSRVTRIDLISAFGGRSRPSKLSMRIFASGPAMSISCRRSSSGSSDSASICSRVITVPKVTSRSDADCWRSRSTVTDDCRRSIGSTSDLPVLAAPDPDVRQRLRLKAGELCCDRVAARGKVLELDLALLARRRGRDERRLGGRLDAGERHGGARQDAPRFVQNSDLQGRVTGGLRMESGRYQAGQTEDHGNSHHWSTLFLPSH